MPQFQYQALNAAQQTIAGELEASSVAQAIAQLEAEGLIVQSIGYAASDARENRTPRTVAIPPVVAVVEQAALEQHLTQVIQRARPLLPALHAYAAEMPPGRYRRLLTKMLEIVERGDTRQAAAGVQHMPTYWIALLSAATASQEPARVLGQFLDEAQRADELRGQWWWTMAYPAVVFGLATALLLFLSFIPIPIFRELFSSFGLRLPWLTQIVLSIAAWITSGQILLVVLAIAVAGFALYKATELLPLSLRNWMGDRFGTPLGRSTAIARFLQFLADLVEAELETASALRIAGVAAQSPRLRRAALRLAGDVDAGDAIETASYRRTITATGLYALRCNLPQQPRIRLIRELSALYANRADRSLSWTRGVVEPIASVLVGMIVGTAVIALFLPLISLIQGLS